MCRVQSKARIHVWVAFQHVSESEESAYASSIDVSTAQLFLLKTHTKKPTEIATLCYPALLF